MKTLIQNGTVHLPCKLWNKKQDLYLADGQCHFEQPDNFQADHVIDASDKWILPGLVDLHAYPCPPNQLYPNTAISHELESAFKRGFTQMVIPPNVHLPELGLKQIRLYKLGALSQQLDGNTLNDLNSLAKSGCVAFSMADKPIESLQILRQFYKYAASFDFKIVIQAMEPSLSKGGLINEGQVSERTGMKGIPAVAEAIAIAQHLHLIEDTGIRAHFSGITTAQAVELIATARKKGLPVTADTIMSHLHLTDIDCADFNPHCHVYPPLRSDTDRKALLKGLEEGVIDGIASYHVPLTSEDKAAPFRDSTPGISGIDTFLSLGLKLVLREELSLETLINAISYGPQQALDLPETQDLVIFDPSVEWLPTGETFLSKGHNSPFKDFPLPGQVELTIALSSNSYA